MEIKTKRKWGWSQWEAALYCMNMSFVELFVSLTHVFV